MTKAQKRMLDKIARKMDEVLKPFINEPLSVVQMAKIGDGITNAFKYLLTRPGGTKIIRKDHFKFKQDKQCIVPANAYTALVMAIVSVTEDWSLVTNVLPTSTCHEVENVGWFEVDPKDFAHIWFTPASKTDLIHLEFTV